MHIDGRRVQAKIDRIQANSEAARYNAQFQTGGDALEHVTSTCVDCPLSCSATY